MLQNKNRYAWLSAQRLYCLVPIVITALAFYGVWGNSFTNWDDDVYVTGNALIRSLSRRTLLTIFSPATFVCGNYHPVTVLSYALNYAAGGLNPAGYILIDLIIHLLNVLLVFIFIRKIAGNDFAASLCALAFGIHPMHVEPVAWISGRKDLLSTFFYLASAITYLSYLEGKNRSGWRWYAVASLLFACSLLSKATAVTLPAALLLIDYYRRRKFSARTVIDKIPFVIPSIVIGLLAVRGQHQGGALDGIGVLTIPTRFSIVCYSFMFYVLKFFVPVKLAALYPYPLSISKSLPLAYLLSPAFTAACLGAAWYFRKSRTLVFGFGFFLVNLLLNLHYIPVSGIVTADRYTYCAYIGLFFIVARYAEKNFAGVRKSGVRVAGGAILCLITLGFCSMVHERCAVWKNGETLWSDVIRKYPSPSASNNRGSYRYSRHDYAGAIDDFNRALEQAPGYAAAWNNRGLSHDALGDRADAAEDYRRALSHNPGYAEAWNNLGQEYYAGGNYEEAMDACNRAIALKPSYAEAYAGRGTILSGRGAYAGAIADYQHAISLKPDYAVAWYNEGRACQAMNDLDRAWSCFSEALTLDPSYAQAYNSRGVVYCLKGDFGHAVADFTRAIALQPLSPDAYVNRGNAYGSMGDYNSAIGDFSRAIGLDPEQFPQAYYGRGIACRSIGEYKNAGEDMERACDLHMDAACRELKRR